MATVFMPQTVVVERKLTMSETCETCRFLIQDGEMHDHYSYRRCTRFPPIQSHKAVEVGVDGWCGEYQFNEELRSPFPTSDQSSIPMPECKPPKDGINHSSGLDKIYYNGHTHIPYNGHLMHDPDCVCFKRVENDETHDSEDLV